MTITVIAAYISEWLGAVGATWLLSLSPRFRRPPIGFKYARRDGLIALSLYGLILVFAFLFYSFRPPVFREPLQLAPAPVIALDQALLLALLCLAAFVVALAVRRQPLRSLGWNRGLITPALQVGFALAILTIFLHNRVMDVLRGINDAGLLALLLALGISLAEETIFRGYIQLRLAWWLGAWPGLILTAALFAIWHLPAWLNHLPTDQLLILLLLTFIQGLILGWIMRKTGNVAAPAFYRTFSIWVQFVG